MLINLNEYREHIYIFENFDGVSPTSGNRGIQDTKYIYDMKFSLVSTTSQPQDEHKLIRVIQISIVHHTLQTKCSNPNTSLKPSSCKTQIINM